MILVKLGRKEILVQQGQLVFLDLQQIQAQLAKSAQQVLRDGLALQDLLGQRASKALPE